jgi:nucleotide-binding universal stress UspA family protein
MPEQREANMRIARVLCPTDLSETSAHAIEWAATVAGYYKAGITALHVLSPIRLAMPGPATTGPGGSVAENEIERLRKEVAAQCGAVTVAGVDMDIAVDIGQPASRILERAASLPADLLVMGTHGTSGFEHLVLGSVTEKVLRKATCPVLTVPPRAQAISHLPFARILCAIDFSESSLAALQYALSLAVESNAALTLLSVLEWPWEEPPPPMIDQLPLEQGMALTEFRRYCEESAMKRLQSLVDSAPLPIKPVSRLRSGKPYVQILAVAAEEQSDLIAIGVRGRSPLDMAVFGSTTNQVVRRATCPVLTFRQ